MKHEIIVSVYDYGYCFSIIIDDCYTDNQEVKRICLDCGYDRTLDDLISYVAGLYDWNAGDVVKVVWCEDGCIETEILTVG